MGVRRTPPECLHLRPTPYLLQALGSLCKIVTLFAHLKACSRRSDSKGWREMKNREKNAKAEEEVERRVRRSFALPRLAVFSCSLFFKPSLLPERWIRTCM